MRDLQRLRFAHETGASALPVALRVPPQQTDGHRMAERAMRPFVDHAVEPSATDALAEVVGRHQAALNRRGANDGRRAASAGEQRMAEVGNRRPSVGRIFRERTADGDVDPRGHVGKGLRDSRYRGTEMRRQHRHCVGPSERHPPRQHLEHDRAKTVHVRAGVDHGTGELLGRRVGQRPEELVRTGQARLLRVTKVGQPKSTTL